ncbi:MAG: site-2 protease family protein [Roseiarcus sp.]
MPKGIGHIAFDRKNGVVELALPNGVPVFVHWSFLVPAILLTQPFWWRGAFALASLFALILFASILLHEIGHMIAAARRDVRCASIAIHALGGEVSLAADRTRKRSVIAIALAGPTMNLALGAAFFAAYWATPEPAPTILAGGWVVLSAEPPLPHLAYVAGLLNIGLAIVNLIPAFRLDGGVIALETLKRHVGFRKATLLVGLSGLAFATLSGLVLIATLIAGFPIWSPPSFEPNWLAVRENWRQRG